MVAQGAQDTYLTSSPQITFWKLVFRRYTNFSMECISQQFNGAPDFGRKVSCVLSRNGDLIHKVYLFVKLPEIRVPAGCRFRWLNWLGYVLLKSVEFTIGGQRIDRHYGEWLYIWQELTCKAGHQAGLANLVGNVPALTRVVDNSAGTTDHIVPSTSLYIPLNFFFCQSPGLALPLIALQYHESRIDMEFRNLNECVWADGFTPTGSMTAELLVDYIYCDSDERRRFAQVSHEYLIPQLQYTGEETATGQNTSIKLNYNHPTKELIWVVQPTTFTEGAGTGPAYGRQWFNFTTEEDPTPLSGVPTPHMGGGLTGGGGLASDATLHDLFGNSALMDTMLATGKNPVVSAKLQLNGHDRMQEREGRYFNLVVPLATHENVPPCGINCYSFALKPEELQGSGTLNFSRLDTATLKLTLDPDTFTGGRDARVKIFAVSYNVLRILSGMGGLAYSS